MRGFSRHTFRSYPTWNSLFITCGQLCISNEAGMGSPDTDIKKPLPTPFRNEEEAFLVNKLSSQLRAQFQVKSPDNALPDLGHFAIGEGFVGCLIGNTVGEAFLVHPNLLTAEDVK